MLKWKNIKECVLDTISDLVGKVEKRARKPWITQEIIRKWMSEGNGGIPTLKKAGGTTGTEERIEKSHRKGQTGIS